MFVILYFILNFLILLTFSSPSTSAEKSFDEKLLDYLDSTDLFQSITYSNLSNICITNRSKLAMCLNSDEFEELQLKASENTEDTNIRSEKNLISSLSSPLQSSFSLITEINSNLASGLNFNLRESALKAINRSLDLFSNRLKEKFSLWLERSSQYIDIMKDILKEKNLPTELVFLPLIESGFNLHAYSRAHAVGPWQFIESTARRYGLIIDWWRDERKDPIKATQAAANYLKDLYRMFGSWELALAAYNAGEGKISRALKRTRSNNYWDLLKTNHIKDETKNYVPHYIAATLIAKNPDEYGFQHLDYREPLYYDEVILDHPVDIEILARCAGTTVNEIRKLNAELRRWSTPPNAKTYKVRIPYGTKQHFLYNLEQIPLEKRFSYDVYRVKKGETLKTISKKLAIPTIAIIELNSFSGLESLKSGDTIKVPPKDKFFVDIQDKMSLKKSVTKKSHPKNKRTANKTNKSKGKIQKT